MLIIILQKGTRLFCFSSLGSVTLISIYLVCGNTITPTLISIIEIQDGCTTIKVCFAKHLSIIRKATRGLAVPVCVFRSWLPKVLRRQEDQLGYRLVDKSLMSVAVVAFRHSPRFLQPGDIARLLGFA